MERWKAAASRGGDEEDAECFFSQEATIVSAEEEESYLMGGRGGGGGVVSGVGCAVMEANRMQMHAPQGVELAQAARAFTVDGINFEHLHPPDAVAFGSDFI